MHKPFETRGLSVKEDVKQFFVGNAIIKDSRGEVLGWGVFEKQLIEQYGFTKQDLRKMAKLGWIHQTAALKKRGDITGVRRIWVYADDFEIARIREFLGGQDGQAAAKALQGQDPVSATQLLFPDGKSVDEHSEPNVFK